MREFRRIPLDGQSAVVLKRPALQTLEPTGTGWVARSPAHRYRDTMAQPNRMRDKCQMDGCQFLDWWWFA